MTLRSRLVAALVAMVVLLGVADLVVVLVERSYLRDQLDQQLEALTPAAGPLLARLAVSDGKGIAAEFSQYYIGRIAPDGRLQTFVAPVDDPELIPVLPNPKALDAPITIGTESGDASRVRLLEKRIGDGSTAVFAASMKGIDAAIRRLVITEAIASAILLTIMGLVVFWVVRLGLRPIRRMTDAADAISAGSTDVRIDVPADGTEAARLGQALNAMLDTTQSTELRLRQFVADASHELRTPLTTLRGYTELFAAGGFADQAAVDDAMRRMGQEATRMSRIVDELLLLARLDERGAAKPERVDVGVVLRDLASDIAVVQPGRPVVIECDAPLAVLIDRDHFVQAISALTTNALRYTDPDVELRLRAQATDGRVRISVIDHGPGIAEADVPHLFDRFYRSDRARARATGGNGLGLAIVASIVSNNGGTYGVQSVVDLGSTFWIELPET